MAQLRMAADEYRQKRRRGSKYRNKKVEVDDITFDSKREARYYQDLKLRKRAGDIQDFVLQPEYLLQEGFTKNGVTHREIKYKADFKIYHNDGSVEIIDVKGMETEVFKIKRKIFEKQYPKLTLKIVK